MTNQSYTYTPFGKASLILETREYAPDGTPLARPDTISSRRIIYGPDHQRWQTVLTDSTGVATTISYAPGCDVVQRGSVKTTSYYLEADGALVAIVKATSTYSDLFLAETDHLGNITGLVNESGTEIYSAEFDAWGQRTVTHSGTAVITPGFLPTSSSVSNYMPLRGYTGHEHYMECGLIDMNGRMYDPLTARFLSPDPYVQMPDNPQNFNRYAYCLNNPLMYTDPSGELFGMVWFTALTDLFVKAFFEGGLDFTSKEARREAWRNFDPTASGTKTNNAIKIEMGLFETDPNGSFSDRCWQLVSRFTRERKQTKIGNLSAHISNMFHDVDVHYDDGVTHVNHKTNEHIKSGFTLGPYINTINVNVDCMNDNLFLHEYGHSIQSRILGHHYLRKVALPSLLGQWLEDKDLNEHEKEWYETQANRLANRKYSDVEWDEKHPLTYSYSWYWVLAHPSLIYSWWLLF